MSIAERVEEVLRDFAPGGKHQMAFADAGRSQEAFAIAVQAAKMQGILDSMGVVGPKAKARLIGSLTDGYSELLAMQKLNRKYLSPCIGVPVTLAEVAMAMGDNRRRAKQTVKGWQSGSQRFLSDYCGWTGTIKSGKRGGQPMLYDSAPLFELLVDNGHLSHGDDAEEVLRELFIKKSVL